jgi:hypothetical protein
MEIQALISVPQYIKLVSWKNKCWNSLKIYIIIISIKNFLVMFICALLITATREIRIKAGLTNGRKHNREDAKTVIEKYPHIRLKKKTKLRTHFRIMRTLTRYRTTVYIYIGFI